MVISLVTFHQAAGNSESHAARRPAPKRIMATMLSVFAAISMAHAETPHVFWQSQPVQKSETVQVQGQGFTTTSAVEIQRLVDDSVSSATNIPAPSLPAPVTLAPYKTEQGAALSGSSLFFTLPNDDRPEWDDGVFAYRVSNGPDVEDKSAIKLLNAPDIWFIQGDLGSRATLGGWLAVHGEALALSGDSAAVKLYLKSTTGSAQRLISAITGPVDVTAQIGGARLKNVSGNSYAQYFQVPADLAPGESYEVYLHNGHGGQAAWAKYAGFDVQPLTTIKIVDAGAVWTISASSHLQTINYNAAVQTWDSTFATAFSALGASGGKIVVGPGVFKFTNSLVLPDRTIIEGDPSGGTVFQWDGPVPTGTSNSGGTNNSHNALLLGKLLNGSTAQRATFALSKLTLERAHSLESQGATASCVERAYTRTEEAFGYLRSVKCETINDAADAIWSHRSGQTDTQNYAALWMRGTLNTEITDSSFDQPVGIFLNGQGPIDETNYATTNRNAYIRLSDTTFRWRFGAIQAIKALHNLIVTGNSEIMLGTEDENGVSGLADIGDFYGSFSHNNRDLYIAHNHTSRETAGIQSNCNDGSGVKAEFICRQLGMSLDGNASAYLGKLDPGQLPGLGSVTLHLANTPAVKREGQGINEPVQRGAIVQILQGTGAGQWRHLVSNLLDASLNPKKTLTLDRAWDVPPDASSWIAINDFQGRMIFYGNDYSATRKLQMYYGTHDIVVANNLIGTPNEPGGINYVIGNHYNGITRGWHFQALNNQVNYGGAVFGESSTAPASNLDEATKISNGFYYVDPAVDPVNGFVNLALGAHVYRNNWNGYTGPFGINLGVRNDGLLLERNEGLVEPICNPGCNHDRLIGFKYFKSDYSLPPENIGLLRSNTTEVGDSADININIGHKLAQQVILDGNNFPATAGPSMLVVNDLGGTTINLARSGYAKASNDGGGYARFGFINGVTTDIGQSGVGDDPWMEIDLRHLAAVNRVKIWPQSGQAAYTAELLISPQPFTGTLDEEKAKPGVSSQPVTVNGNPYAINTLSLPNVTGRYVRLWRQTSGTTTANMRVSEIGVYGGEARPEIELSLTATPASAVLGDQIQFSATVTNTGAQAVHGLIIEGLGCTLPAVELAPNASTGCTESVTASALGTLSRTVRVVANETEVTLANNSATASATVQGLLSVSKIGSGGGTVTGTGIACGADCSEAFNAGTVVALSAVADGSSTFTGWGGACGGTGACTVTIDTSNDVTANFDAATANLAVTMNGSTPVKTDTAYAYTVTVTNQSTASAAGVTAGITLPGGVSGTATPTQGSCSGSAGTLTCSLGTLAGQGTLTISVNATASAEGVFDATSTLQELRTFSAAVSATNDPAGTKNAAHSATIQLACQGLPVSIRGTSGVDGTSFNWFGGSSQTVNDVIHGLSGNDLLSGRNGNDVICGGAGNDQINGDAGTDTVYGQSGNDTLYGGSGTDVCDGGDGTDSTGVFGNGCETRSNVP